MSLEPRGLLPGQDERSNAKLAVSQTHPGSVRRARQMMEAGIPMEQWRPTVNNEGGAHASRIQQSRSSPGNPSSLYPQTPGQRIPGNLRLQSGVYLSRPIISAPSPAPQPQWPLREENNSARRLNNSPSEDRSRAKGAPPQRPPRPSYVPSFLDVSKTPSNTSSFHHRQPQQVQRPQPSVQQQPHYWEDPYSLSSGQDSDPRRTIATGTSSSSSRPSTSSSVGSIPDFPVPSIPLLQPQQSRRSINLGPPPSSRRGASSYYSQSSYVTPIPEELPESNANSHGSYASSHVIPNNWVDGPAEFYLGDGVAEEEEDVAEFEDGRQSRGGDHHESTGLVRKVSLGKQHKPSLTTIRSSDELNKEDRVESDDVINSQTSKQDSSKPSLVSRAALATGVAGSPFATGLAPRAEKDTPTNNSFETGTGFLDASSSSNDDSAKSPSTLTTEIPSSTLDTRSRSPISAAMDARVRQIMGGLERGGALESGTPAPATEKSTRRPPRLNMDAVKDAEARGSLTSLPDLIRRATKLASNLDRGRTASRLGMFDMLNAGESPNGQRSASLSDMLASFPPPGPTPTGDRPPSRWPSPFANSGLAQGQITSPNGSTSHFADKKRDRRCCGMPLWAFTILLIILVLLIAAAVVIPVTLIVLPRQAANAKTAGSANASNCQQSTPCAHGGTSITTATSCSCICVNGFTGPMCTHDTDSGCTTTTINSNDQSLAPLNNVTLGSSIPRLLSAAQSNFSIPLNSSAILSSFSATNLTCTSENALVTFNSQSQRRGLLPEIILNPSLSSMPLISHTIAPRGDTTTTTVSQQITLQAEGYAASTAGVYTSNGIIFAGSTTVTASFTTPTPLATASSTTSSSSSSSSSQPVSQKDLDFARVAVLYIFQQTRLDNAVNAQEIIQNFFNDFNKSSIDVGNGVTLDFEKGTIDLANGTTVGGRGG